MSYIGTPFADNTNLLNTTVSSVVTGTGIDVSGYATALIQVTGSSFSGIITFERSLDNVYWSPALVTELNALNQKTQIDSAGLYFVRTEAQYLRYNVVNITGSATIVIDGTTSVVSNADKVAWAMDDTNNTPLNIKFQPQNSGVKQDLSGAFILSDAPQPVTITAAIGEITIIDTTGYQSIHLTSNATFAATNGFQFSNDNIQYTPAVPNYNTSGISQTLIQASSNYVVPCYGRFAKIICTTAGSFTYYLRNTSSQFSGQNLAAINGAAVSAASAQLGVNVVQINGVAPALPASSGIFPVGGAIATNGIAASAPVLIGGVDPSNLTRRTTTNALGDLITGNRTIPSSAGSISYSGSPYGITGNTPIGAAGYNNQVPTTIQDTSQFEGQTQIELLAQLLQEVKILNHQMYELPRVIALALQGPTAPQQGQSIQLGDEPYQLRQDSSLFINQQ